MLVTAGALISTILEVGRTVVRIKISGTELN